MFTKRRRLVGTVLSLAVVGAFYSVLHSKIALEPSPDSNSNDGNNIQSNNDVAFNRAPLNPHLKNGMVEHEPVADTLGGRCSPW